jgi:hypothetical protein
MIEPIEWYEAQKEKYKPIISQFDRELAFYVGNDLSEFKINLPAFQVYLESDRFKDKFNAALKAYRIGIAKSQISNGQIDAKSGIKIKQNDASDFVELINAYLDNIAAHEITVPNIAIVEILFSLANSNNIRLKRQQTLYKQLFARLAKEPYKMGENSDIPCYYLWNFLSYIGGLGVVLLKDTFNETDLQYPLLLALSLSHTSPREVQIFLDKQTPQYEGDFTKVLETALSEYDDLLLSSQVREAYRWLKEYQPPHIETIEIVEEETEVVDSEPTNEPIEIKPTLNFHSATIGTISEALKPYFIEAEHPLLDKLLNGQTIEERLYFRGQSSTIMGFLRDLLNDKITSNGQTQTARWLSFYFNADNQRTGTNQPMSESTAINYFKSDKNPHIKIDIKAILIKKTQKNTV